MENKKEIENEKVMEEAVKSDSVKKVILVREKVTGKDGKEYNLFRVKGKVRGRDVRADFNPKDKGGYGILDIIYEINDKPELIIAEEKMKDSDGHVTRYKTYTVRAIDEDGQEYSLPLKPARESDKAYLDMMFKK